MSDITRKQTIKVLESMRKGIRCGEPYIENEEAYQEQVAALDFAIKALEQEPRTGHWIPTYGNVKCSVCGSVKDSREVGKATHYCDFCGARMIEPQESEDKE